MATANYAIRPLQYIIEKRISEIISFENCLEIIKWINPMDPASFEFLPKFTTQWVGYRGRAKKKKNNDKGKRKNKRGESNGPRF